MHKDRDGTLPVGLLVGVAVMTAFGNMRNAPVSAMASHHAHLACSSSARLTWNAVENLLFEQEDASKAPGLAANLTAPLDSSQTCNSPCFTLEVLWKIEETSGRTGI